MGRKSTDLVSPEPRLGEMVHPLGAGREQHDAEIGIEQVEHLGPSITGVAARLEERFQSRRGLQDAGGWPRGSTPSM
jgi:hypothetical protein